MGPNQTYTRLCSNGNHQQSEKTIYGMGENIYKQCDQKGLSFQNIQAAHSTLQQKTKSPIEKCTEVLNRHFSRRYIDGQLKRYSNG